MKQSETETLFEPIGLSKEHDQDTSGVDDSVEVDDLFTSGAHESEDTPAWSRWDSEPLPALPKMAAVRRAYEACVSKDLPDGFAWALANAATDPAALRSTINGAPRSMTVNGGRIEFIEVDLFTPGVTAMVTNHRAFGERIYPAAGANGGRAPLHGPMSADGICSTLVIDGHDPEHVIGEADRTRTFVLNDNKLAQSIRERGIVMPVDVVYTEIRHENGEPPARVLATAEGSSRISNAHEVLGLSQARELLYDMPGDIDLYRRQVNNYLVQDPRDAALSPRQAARLRGQQNALFVRARVLLRYVPAPASRYTYAEALSGYLGMIHVDGPRQWSNTGKNEAMAESVLNALHRDDSGRVSALKREYLAGLLTPEQAAANSLPVEADAQSAYVLATLLDPSVSRLVSRAIRDVTATARVTGGRKAEVVAELALRPIRSLASTLDQADPAREEIDQMAPAYRRACRMSRYAAGGWRVTGREPDEILRAALEELTDEEPTPADASFSARTELAALAQFHLTRYGALRRERFGSGGQESVDKRGPGEVIGAMMHDQRGLYLLHRAVVDGRAGRRPRIVDHTGKMVRGYLDGDDTVLVESIEGGDVAVTDNWLRYEAYPDSRSGLPVPSAPEGETPAMELARLKMTVGRVSSQLEEFVDAIERLVDSSDTPIIEQQGWATDPVLARLNDVVRRLTYWDGLARRMAARTQR